MHAGYRQADEDEYIPTLEFILGATDATYYTTDTRIVVVEDQGLLEKVVVGKVIEVNGLVLTVDKWDGTTLPCRQFHIVWRLEFKIPRYNFQFTNKSQIKKPKTQVWNLNILNLFGNWKLIIGD